MRRSWLRGLEDMTKRYVLAAAGHNLGRILLALLGSGKPREAADLGLWPALKSAWDGLKTACRRTIPPWEPSAAFPQPAAAGAVAA